MKKLLIMPLTAGILASGCAGDNTKNTERDITDTLSSSQEKKTPQSKINYTSTILESWQEEEIKATISSYLCFFNTSIPEITIIEKDTIDENLSAYASPGTIYVVTENIKKLDKKNLKCIIGHELFHVLKAKEPLAILPYTLKDGATMTGFHGLSIAIQSEGKEVGFNLIEEASAEALALMFNPEYYQKNHNLENYHYENMGLLMYKIIGKGWLTSDDIIQAEKTNGVDVLIGKIINRTPENEDIENIMGIFNDVYNAKGDTSDEAMDKIEAMIKQ